MGEKRYYERIKVNINTLLYIKGNGEEIVCKVIDISEKGICFKIPFNISTANIKPGDTLTFQFSDSFYFGRELEEEIITDTCKVIYVTKTSHIQKMC